MDKIVQSISSMATLVTPIVLLILFIILASLLAKVNKIFGTMTKLFYEELENLQKDVENIIDFSKFQQKEQKKGE